MLNPSTVGKMIKGRDILLGLKSEISTSGNCFYNNMQIKSSSIERGIKLYEIGINKFLGKTLIRRIENKVFKTMKELQKILIPQGAYGRGEWVDLAGLITPKNEVEKFLVQIESDKLASSSDMNKSFAGMFKSYFEWEWTWACEKIEEEVGISADKLKAADVIDLLERWKKSVLELDTLIYEDVEKEFAPASMTGFGIDGGEDIRKLDFKNVRGDIETNNYVMSITEHTIVKTAIGDELINRLRGIIK
jgi:hypothetical protein